MAGADCTKAAISSRENIVCIALFISVKIGFVGKIIDKRLGRVSIQEQTVSIEEHSDDFQPIWSWIEIKCSWIEIPSDSLPLILRQQKIT